MTEKEYFMTPLKYLFLALLLVSATASATPASEESVKQLMVVTQSQKLLDGMQKQIDALMTNAVRQGLQGKTPSLKQQQAIEKFKNSIAAVVKEQLSWEKQEPMYVRLYRQTFTEEEITGMLAFYKTPAGQAVINKMPALMLQTLAEIQKQTVEMAPKMERIKQQFYADMAAAKE